MITAHIMWLTTTPSPELFRKNRLIKAIPTNRHGHADRLGVFMATPWLIAKQNVLNSWIKLNI